MEEEVRSILANALNDAKQGPSLSLAAVLRRRFEGFDEVELEIPPRGPGREPPDLSQ